MRRKRIKKHITVLILNIFILTSITFSKPYYASPITNNNVKSVITYKDGVEAANWAYSGLNFLKDKKMDIPIAYYNLKQESISSFQYNNSLNNNSDYCMIANFYGGLSTISSYMATGDIKYLNTAKATANFLNSVISQNGLIPQYSIEQKKIIEDSSIFVGSGGQAGILEFISYLAKEDSSYLPLMNKLAQGLIKYGINDSNNLAWFKLNVSTGQPVKSPVYGYESQLGSQSVSCAQALLSAYETDNTKIQYKTKALDILKSIWNCRNRSTNLIPESYDILNNKPGEKLYPYGNFRYDDMGGAYIRGLVMAYSITKDKEIFYILKTYTTALTDGVWDKDMGDGMFRYLNSTDDIPLNSGLETMHGLFISSLLEANELLYKDSNTDIVNRCKTHADHVLIDGFGVKNLMIPHQLSRTGDYINTKNDSQLAYAVLQFPLGYSMLSNVTGNDSYRLKDNEIYSALLNRHKIGDNVVTPKGYVNILETKPPYGFELEYYSPQWMWHAFYIPSYLLFNSIHPDKEVKIDWYNGCYPNVFGLVSDMPYWDIKKVKMKNNTLTLSNVTGKGKIDLNDMGYKKIHSVKIDGKKYINFSSNILTTQEGTHCYEISFEE